MHVKLASYCIIKVVSLNIGRCLAMFLPVADLGKLNKRVKQNTENPIHRFSSNFYRGSVQ